MRKLKEYRVDVDCIYCGKTFRGRFQLMEWRSGYFCRFYERKVCSLECRTNAAKEIQEKYGFALRMRKMFIDYLPDMKTFRQYRIWQGMRSRCYREKNPNYGLYGGRGVKICDEWRNSFEAFYLWSVANGYDDALSLDRINPYGDYEPGNCRWATAVQQANNKRSSTFPSSLESKTGADHDLEERPSSIQARSQKASGALDLRRKPRTPAGRSRFDLLQWRRPSPTAQPSRTPCESPQDAGQTTSASEGRQAPSSVPFGELPLTT